MRRMEMRIRRVALGVILLGLPLAALGSEPGEQLGPEDWELSEPGMFMTLPLPLGIGGDPRTNSRVPHPESGDLLDFLASGSHVLASGSTLDTFEVGDTAFCGDNPMKESHVLSISEAGTVTVIARLRDRCVVPRFNPDNSTIDRVESIAVGGYDPNAGTAVIRIFRFQWSPGGPEPDYPSGTVLFRIHGLPKNLDFIPEGPPGPIGPPGPPGTPADESRVLTLEQQVSDQQALIESLQTTLTEIESLPTIQRLLDKVEELESQQAP